MNLSLPRKRTLLAYAIVVAIAFVSRATRAETPHKKTGVQGNVQQQLVSIETGFFEAWKTKDDTYFRSHMLASGVFWGEDGTLARDQQLQKQQASAKTCAVEGYGLSDFHLLPLTTGAYLLTYTAEQYATCGGEKLPIHITGSSIYVFKERRWQAIYRAEVPMRDQL
jgi:hypothetical protein